jgi:hypothetical protein
MSIMKQYNTGTSQWEAVQIGVQGPSGVIAVNSPITNVGTSSSASLGLDYSSFQYGQNLIINGGFDIWQRGTSFTYAGGYPYTADRWRFAGDGSGYTRTVTQQAFTTGTAPVAGYEASYFLRFNASVAGTGGTWSVLETALEDVRTLAGQTATFSFWAKADAARTIGAGISYQIFGTGGSANVTPTMPSVNLTTSWTRYSVTFTVPSIAGKTIGTGSNIIVGFTLPVNTVQTIDIWGVQLEAGPTATPFKRSASTLQGELAACQRYYVRFASNIWAVGTASSGTQLTGAVNLPVPLRAYTTTVEASGVIAHDGANYYTGGTLTAAGGGQYGSIMSFALTFGSSVLTTYRPYRLSNIDGSSYIAFSAEL